MKKFIIGFISCAIILTGIKSFAANWSYIPITNAFRADRPVFVEGKNVNDGLYPVINYKPDGAQYPYLYIPLAMFQELGMNVDFDMNTNTAYVTNPNKNAKETISSLETKVAQLENELENNRKGHTQYMNHIEHFGYSGYEARLEEHYYRISRQPIEILNVTEDSVTYKLALWDSPSWTSSFPEIDHTLFFKVGKVYSQTSEEGTSSEFGVLFVR